MGLFDPITIGRFHSKNHFCRAAAKEQLCSPGGHIPQEIYDFYEKLAAGGVGTIIVSSASVKLFDGTLPQGLFRLDRHDLLQDYKRLADIGHKYGCTMIIQMSFSKRKLIDDMTTFDLKRIATLHGEAARFAMDAGFDGVEIHEAHGSWMFLATVLKPEFNHRTDEYGQNKSLLGEEIIRTVREYTSDDFIIFVKTDGKDEANGYTLEMSIDNCRKLEAAGADLIEVSGVKYFGHEGRQFEKNDFSYYSNEAVEIAKNVSSPVMLVGNNKDLSLLETLHEEHGIAAFSICRSLTREFDLINRWASGDRENGKCICCGACNNTFAHECPFNKDNPFDPRRQPYYDDITGKELRPYDLLTLD